ncbi:MAG: hypothetical protein PUB96_06875 [Helicobacteraceae bacterium]|nr:hypothetical protein [Helicobacteraceae bacterium]
MSRRINLYGKDFENLQKLCVDKEKDYFHFSFDIVMANSHLEISILNKSEILKDNENFRIDSEYVKREYRENEERI